MPIDHSDQPPANPERSKPEPFMTALVGHRQRRKPKPTPPPAKNRGFKGLVIVLLVLILAVLIWPRFSEGSEERDCNQRRWPYSGPHLDREKALRFPTAR